MSDEPFATDMVYTVTDWRRNKVRCEKELGEWTVRIGGYYIQSFKPSFPFGGDAKAEKDARALAMRLIEVLGRP